MKQAFMKTGQAILTVAAFSLLAATAVQAAESDTATHHEKTMDHKMDHKMKGHHPAVVMHRKHHPHPLMKHHHHPMHPMHPMKPETPAH